MSVFLRLSLNHVTCIPACALVLGFAAQTGLTLSNANRTKAEQVKNLNLI